MTNDPKVFFGGASDEVRERACLREIVVAVLTVGIGGNVESRTTCVRKRARLFRKIRRGGDGSRSGHGKVKERLIRSVCGGRRGGGERQVVEVRTSPS